MIKQIRYYQYLKIVKKSIYKWAYTFDIKTKILQEFQKFSKNHLKIVDAKEFNKVIYIIPLWSYGPTTHSCEREKWYDSNKNNNLSIWVKNKNLNANKMFHMPHKSKLQKNYFYQARKGDTEHGYLGRTLLLYSSLRPMA
jgi:hypothetical protein